MVNPTVGGINAIIDIAQTITEKVEKATKYSAYTKNTSLIDVTKPLRVEPLVIMDVDVANLNYTQLIMRSLFKQFTGYYITALQLINQKVNDVSIYKSLSQLNPSQDIDTSIGAWKAAVEEYSVSIEGLKYSLEADLKPNLKSSMSNKIVTPNYSDISKIKDLSVGYPVSIKLSTDKNVDIAVTVNIRLLVNMMNSSAISDIFTMNDNYDLDLKERFHSWRAGRLSLVGDLIFCNDLIDAKRKNLIKDKDGVYSSIVKRENSAKIAAGFLKSPNLAVASNIAVISQETANMIEQRSSVQFKDFNKRKLVFDNTNLMILAVVDKEWERVKFYYRGINDVNSLSVKELGSSDDNSTQVVDIMKSFLQGSAPQF